MSQSDKKLSRGKFIMQKISFLLNYPIQKHTKTVINEIVKNPNFFSIKRKNFTFEIQGFL